MKIIMMFCTAKVIQDEHNLKIKDNLNFLMFLQNSEWSDKNGGYFNITNYNN